MTTQGFGKRNRERRPRRHFHGLVGVSARASGYPARFLIPGQVGEFYFLSRPRGNRLRNGANHAILGYAMSERSNEETAHVT